MNDTLECVVTCVDYSDFLAYTLEGNKSLFDRLVVVTSPQDKLTQNLCEYRNVECVSTDAFNLAKGQFRKGAGINEGLKRLSCQGWVVHLDADILLPPLFRQMISNANLDPSMIYGADRLMCGSFEEWTRFLSNPKLLHESSAWIHLDSFPLGVRVYSPDYGGYVPIGYFQMWQPAASGIRSYPDNHTSAGRGDMLFARQWPRAKRGLIPEVCVYHLESEPAAMGANWSGRTTKLFIGAKPLIAMPNSMRTLAEYPGTGKLATIWNRVKNALAA